MNYQEYQMWYHGFINALQFLPKNEDLDIFISNCNKVADHIAAKFKTVDMSNMPSDINLQELVNGIANNIAKTNKKR